MKVLLNLFFLIGLMLCNVGMGTQCSDVIQSLQHNSIRSDILEKNIQEIGQLLSSEELKTLLASCDEIMITYRNPNQNLEEIIQKVYAELYFQLGCHFEQAIRGIFDVTKTIENYRKASLLGHKKAKLRLAQNLLNARDSSFREEAIKNLEELACENWEDPALWDWEALNELGACFEAGIVNRREDNNKALVCYKKAVKRLKYEGYSLDFIKELRPWKNIALLITEAELQSFEREINTSSGQRI